MLQIPCAILGVTSLDSRRHRQAGLLAVPIASIVFWRAYFSLGAIVTTVQVIVPCYNYGRYLYSCVQSVLSQDGVDSHVLIIDDHSSDNTPDVCLQLSSEDGRVEFIRHEANRGHIATYNEGIGLTTRDYVVLLSSDDLLTPGSLSRATALMNKHPSVGLVYGHPIAVYGEELPPARSNDSGWTIWSGRDWIERMCLAGKNFIFCPEVVMRTSVQHLIGGYKASLPHSGDMEMWLRAAAVSDVGRINGADQAYSRSHPANMQHTVHAGILFDLKGRRDAFQSAFESEAGRLPDGPSLLAIAKRSLALTAIRYACQAIDSGRTPPEPISEYCDFARSLDPEVASTRLWHRLERLQRGNRGVIATILGRGQAELRNLAFQFAWRRWWRTGVWPPA